MKRQAAAWIAVAVAAGASLGATLWPRRFKFLEDAIPGGDKGGHFVIMGLLAAVLVWALSGTTWRGHRLTSAMCLAGTLLMVSLEEASQLAIRGRFFSWLDLAYSWAGVLMLGGCAAILVRRRMTRDAIAARRT